jgi:hypothetical protein
VNPAEAARRQRVGLGAVYLSRAYRELCLERDVTDVRHLRRVHYGHTGGVQRALEYLATHAPQSLNEVALAANTSRTNLKQSTRFRVAWAEYRARGPRN